VSKATASERTKASRIRRAIARGDKVTDEARGWFADYERAHPDNTKPGRPAAPPQPAPSESGPVPPDTTAEPTESLPPSSEPAAATPHVDPTRFVDPSKVSSGAPPGSSPAAAPAGAPRCQIPDCPECAKKRGGGTLCIETGTLVYPMMTKPEAEGLSVIALGVLSGLGTMLGRLYDHYTLEAPPAKPRAFAFANESEITDFAEALRVSVYKRASYLGKDADLGALLWHGGRGVKRGFNGGEE
jgi:hypothetical protein